MKQYKKYNSMPVVSVLFAAILLLVACDGFMTPDRDNVFTENEILRNPVMAEGILLNAYSSVPNTSGFSEVATDDAVSNDNSNNYRLATNGEWKSTNNPFNVWSGSYSNIAYLNLFLSIVDEVQWSNISEYKNENFRKRLTGEAYALRALFQLRLLQAHSGVSEGGQLLGFPIVNKAITINDDWQGMQRNPYEECVGQILSDINQAIDLLPDTYSNADAADINKGDMDAVYGSRFVNRADRRVALMLKARTLLHAASPAFNLDNNSLKWNEAAQAAAAIINLYGGLEQLKSSRIEYYLSEGNGDILWRKDYTNSRNLETDNFPPSLFGNGRVNPTQNFVDAFPTANGVPIQLLTSGYDITDPYKNRDPRLSKYVIYNGASLKNTTINTIDGAKDGVNMLADASTRTGYYLRKLMNPNVNLTPGNVINQRHFATLMRYTEAFLIYAEAANEAWGPDGTGGNAYSARQVIAKLRETAGITNDNYLNTITSKEDMRELIRNERRIELSFEGVRFWDLRRWKSMDKINETAHGTKDGGLSAVDVERRVYENYMIYGPIPDSEFRKGLFQNQGW